MILLLFLSGPMDRASARPEYALKYGTNRCTTCHLSPVGGGERNSAGKLHGARNQQLGPYSEQDLFSADIRALYYRPQLGRDGSKGGMGFMAAIIAANIPLTPASANREMRVVFSHNIGGFASVSSGNARNLFLRWMNYDDTDYHLYPQYILFGRFQAPFGILSDEHRVYTHVQTRNTWNDFEMGALASGDFSANSHYDFAVVNGEKTAGIGLAPNRALLWGQILNLRFTPARIPVMFGVSGSYHQRAAGKHNPWAGVGYFLLSLDRLSAGRVSGTVLMEYSRAKFWNEGIVAGFITDPTYLAAVRDTESEGIMAQVNWDMSDLWTLIYRFDSLVLDRNFPSDAYMRHGVGLKYAFGANMFVQGRIEDGQAHHPLEKDGGGLGAIDAFWMLLQVGI